MSTTCTAEGQGGQESREGRKGGREVKGEFGPTSKREERPKKEAFSEERAKGEWVHLTGGDGKNKLMPLPKLLGDKFEVIPPTVVSSFLGP